MLNWVWYLNVWAGITEFELVLIRFEGGINEFGLVWKSFGLVLLNLVWYLKVLLVLQNLGWY